MAYPGDMLQIADMMPPSSTHARIVEWKKMTTQYGGGEVLDGVVIADGNEPNHWVYLDPNAPSGDDEWTVVEHTPSDDSTYTDVLEFVASRLEGMRARHKILDK